MTKAAIAIIPLAWPSTPLDQLIAFIKIGIQNKAKRSGQSQISCNRPKDKKKVWGGKDQSPPAQRIRDVGDPDSGGDHNPGRGKVKEEPRPWTHPLTSSINPITRVNPIATSIPVRCLSAFRKIRAVINTAKNIGIPPPWGPVFCEYMPDEAFWQDQSQNPVSGKRKWSAASQLREIINAKAKGKTTKFNFSMLGYDRHHSKKAAKYITVRRSTAPSITTATTMSCR